MNEAEEVAAVNYVLTLDELSALTREGGKPAETLMNVVALIAKRFHTDVKRWHGGDQRERWVGSGLLVAENQFRRITGYKLIPVLMEELKILNPSKAAVVKRRKAS